MNILDQLDRAIDGRCPCGADPRPGSAYCGPDCEPTHISDDTDTRQTGRYATPMRWRPDLVTATDDTHLVRVDQPGAAHGYTGRHNASVHRHIDRSDLWHLRLDDGHRYVGLDITEDELFNTPDFTAFIRDKWARLERELGNSRHLEPDGDPWADVMEGALRRFDETLFGTLTPPIDLGAWRAHVAADVESRIMDPRTLINFTVT